MTQDTNLTLTEKNLELVNVADLKCRNPVVWHDESGLGNSILIRIGTTMTEAEQLKQQILTTVNEYPKLKEEIDNWKGLYHDYKTMYHQLKHRIENRIKEIREYPTRDNVHLAFIFEQLLKGNSQIAVDDSSTNSAVNNQDGGQDTVSTAGDDIILVIDNVKKHLQKLYQDESDKEYSGMLNDAIVSIENYRERKNTESQIKILEESTKERPEET